MTSPSSPESHQRRDWGFPPGNAEALFQPDLQVLDLSDQFTGKLTEQALLSHCATEIVWGHNSAPASTPICTPGNQRMMTRLPPSPICRV